MEEESQIKYFLMGNVQKDLIMYEFVNTNSAQTIFEAKQIFQQFVQDKRTVSEKIKTISKNKYFYIFINNYSNFYLIYVENIITMGHSFEILEKIDKLYTENMLENENDMDSITELTPEESRRISNVLTNYEIKYRKKIETKNKSTNQQKSSRSETTKPATKPETLRSGILKRKSAMKSEEDINNENNNDNNNLNINNNLNLNNNNNNNDDNNLNINNNKNNNLNLNNNNDNDSDNLNINNKNNNNIKNIDIIIEEDTPKEERNDELLNLKKKKSSNENEKQVKFDIDSPFINQEVPEQLINDLTDKNKNKLSFIINDSNLSRNKTAVLVFLIIIALIIIGMFIYILLTTDSV